MAYDEGLAQRIRDACAGVLALTEKKMFGGLCVLSRGNMLCGVVGDMLMARVGPDLYAEALARPHAREMDFTGKALKGFVYVDAEGIEADADLEAWVQFSLRFVEGLPAK